MRTNPSIERTSNGKRFDLAKVDEMRPGMTTMAEAEQVLGPPTSRSNFADGTTLLQWMKNEPILFAPRGAHVAVLFGRDGRMVRVTHRFATGY
jgi:hypothetical protein